MSKLFTIIFVFISLIYSDRVAQTIFTEDFGARRENFMAQMEPNSVAVFQGAKVKTRNSDIHYKFRQESNFHYLSGYDEPNALMILDPSGEKKYILFIQEKTYWEKLFEGNSPGPTELMQKLGADTVYYSSQFDGIFRKVTRGKTNIYFNLDDDKELNDKIINRANVSHPLLPHRITNPNQLLAEMRLIKTKKEIQLLQKAIDITGEAQIEMMKAAKSVKSENELHGVLQYVYYKNGCERSGFPSIIASGINMSTLHYDSNDANLYEGDLVMADIGAEYEYYSADITRTFPVNGKFSDLQKAIYKSALRSTDAIINYAKPGVSISAIEEEGKRVLKEELYKLGLITDATSEWQYLLYQIYPTCHWLGIDPHDVGDYFNNTGSKLLQPGMVIAVEPGIYIDKKMYNKFPKIIQQMHLVVSEDEIIEFMRRIKSNFGKYDGICCRIEDNIVITENGSQNLSQKIPREINEIEKVMESLSHLVKN